MPKTSKKIPQIVIFGRTNVGKSTLFNCLTENKQALVSNIEGTTRDSNIGLLEWQGRQIELIDTGGILDLKFISQKKIKTNTIDEEVQKRVREYLLNADLILFLVDTKTGLMPQDTQIARLLQKVARDNISLRQKTILVANKTDSPRERKNIFEFNKLGIGEPFPISAATGSGTGDLLDIIVKKTKAPRLKIQKEKEKNEINISIIGKPNVGKSSLLNSILGYKRVIVNAEAHTTREPQNTQITYKDQIINLIDTAGISKKGQKTKGLEKYGIEKSLKILKKSDIALLVIDIHEGITHQDARLIDEILERSTSFIIIANKWDLIEEKDAKYHTKYIHSKFPFCTWAPIHFTSARNKSKTDKILDIILEINRHRQIALTTSFLNKFLNRIVKIHAPAKAKGIKHPRIYELRQIRTNPPKFKIRIGSEDTIHFSYLRFIQNKLRDKFGFLGTPLKIFVENNKKIHGRAG